SADNDLLIEGINNYYDGLYRQAINNFNTYINDKNENTVDALYYQTLAYLQLNQVVDAKANISFLSEMGYSFGILHWELGELYLNENGYYDSPFYNEAKKELEKAKQLGIESAGLHSDLATAYQGLGNFEKAADEYEMAIKKGAISDYINLASLYMEVGKFDSALNVYKKAVQENPESPSIYINMGDIYLQKEEYEEAINILQQGNELDSSIVGLQTKLAKAYYFNEDYEKAKQIFSSIVKDNPNIYEAYYYLAEIYNKVEENTELAINYYQQAVSYNRNYVKAYLALGDIYLEKDENYKAMSQYLKALESNSDYPDAHYRLALAYNAMNMKQAAIEELKKTLHLDSSNNKARLLLNKLQEE
ncbi:MAG: tetratricopeptide repeat protein, partial [Halanaerobiales bacterium]